ncbi:acetyl-CoA decarbonylase/synthase complex subunit gamma [Dehalococcoides mccartyi]|jgi:acetyl-CoA decarbonylase/synthase complex subunit gamma|uniref:acetyl-CoA decarbonylase/synthase complex subunit gamma n=1 Tax=Dehalococcoides TaxID=61434 RepID=UPI0002B761C8|nr:MULTISPECIES: acetyl-CoA decarbonylase/synthase complex subunit gamma [Dehalococcoides]AGG06294.1 acetyl-CoA synthase, corrinoid iron-sulfur protein, large subunit [Dehalococcoides mccartyi DCMB5]KSV16929.1 acetyl-CoA decarbonylase/synthase complex subunit gamma [Dehalococcoides mccartyi]BAS31704.1 acetyl-CoA decarbonylase/synthase complex subunit gamma [Dehalococcoides mccartyi IBARAKI]BEL00690.1 acetyl-CoA decarbonylase/synthase complex subunit gamma [Dehalococcoides mccartyi]
MSPTGIEIYKFLPRTNCGECGVPTCLAFAMSLAGGRAELSSCPYVSEETKLKLEEASAPPVRTVSIGTGIYSFKIGGETVMHRHEKRFEHQSGIALLLSDNLTETEQNTKLTAFNSFQYKRVGAILKPDMLALRADSGSSEKYLKLVKLAAEKCQASLMLICANTTVLDESLKICAERKPLLHAATAENSNEMAELAKKYNCPLVAKAKNLTDLAELTIKLQSLGIKDIVLDSSPASFKQTLADNIAIRRAAILKKFRPLGFPVINFPCLITSDHMKESLFASILTAKYAGILVLSDFRGETLFPLLVARMNLYTDPQRPLATTEGIYEINNPDANSPVMLTCNFSLTYFIVAGEMETSRVPCYLLIKDTEGLSVMTAWAAGKFGADTIGKFVKNSGIAGKVNHRKLIIPGYASMESGGLEEELSGWEIMVGPREAAHIPAYLKQFKP